MAIAMIKSICQGGGKRHVGKFLFFFARCGSEWLKSKKYPMSNDNTSGSPNIAGCNL